MENKSVWSQEGAGNKFHVYCEFLISYFAFLFRFPAVDDGAQILPIPVSGPRRILAIIVPRQNRFIIII